MGFFSKIQNSLNFQIKPTTLRLKIDIFMKIMDEKDEFYRKIISRIRSF